MSLVLSLKRVSLGQGCKGCRVRLQDEKPVKETIAATIVITGSGTNHWLMLNSCMEGCQGTGYSHGLKVSPLRLHIDYRGKRRP